MANIIVRTLLLFFSLLIMLRLMGKRQIAQLQPYEFALMLISSNLITVPMSDLDTPILWGIVPIYVLLLTGLSLSMLSLKSTTARKVICGKPRLLIEKGIIVESALKKVRYTMNDLLEQLRSNDVFDISEVYYAYLETNGEISVILKSQFRSVQPKDLSISPLQEEAEIVLVMDGKIQKQNLIYINRDIHWLDKIIKRTKINLKDILILTYDGTTIFAHSKGENPSIKELTV